MPSKKTVIPLKTILGFIKKDPTAWSLLFANSITLFYVFFDNLDLFDLIYLFYIQSIIIGFFTFFTILDTSKRRLEKISNPNFEQRTDGVVNIITFIFAFSFLHLIYLFFIGIPSTEILINLAPLYILFFINHLFSYIYFKLNGVVQKLHGKEILNSIEQRLLPLHIFIICAPIIIGILALVLTYIFSLDKDIVFSHVEIVGIYFFVIIKTCVDVYYHVKKHLSDYTHKISPHI
jgi:hypothetical protein